MTWYKVDDGFHSSRKLIHIPRALRLQAAGLWAIAGSWSGAKESDGLVPVYMLDEWGASNDIIDALCEARLWERKGDCIQFVNWGKYQPTRADREEKRRQDRERKAEWRDRKRVTDVSQCDSTRSPDGVRSIPTRPVSKRSSSNAARSTPYTDEFLDWYKHYPRKVGKGAAAKAYAKLTADEHATLNDITHAYAQTVKDAEERFIPHPATWLNDRRFDDHPDPTPTPMEFLRDCWKCGATAQITELTGYQPDAFRWPEPVPDDFDQDAALLEHRRAWIDANRDDLARALGAVL